MKSATKWWPGAARARGSAAALNDPASVDHPDLVAEERCFVKVVGDEHHRNIEGLEDLRELAAGAGARAGVKRRKRFVE